jgi:hypothetical protein
MVQARRLPMTVPSTMRARYLGIGSACATPNYLTVLYAIADQRPMFKKKTSYSAMQDWKKRRLC